MNSTITGKSKDLLKKEILNLYNFYSTEDKEKIAKEHADKENSFSKIIKIYTENINLINSPVEENFLEFYKNYMSIKVMQLIYRSWKNPEISDYKHEGLEGLEVMPGVFSPKVASDSYLWAKYMVDDNLVEGKDVMEMGAGSGIISFYLYKNGNPNSITAVDINKQAIENIKENVQNLKIDNNFNVIHSNLFENVSSENKYDVIFWAYVWLKIEDEGIKNIIKDEEDQNIRNLLFSVSDPDYKMLDNFIEQSRKYLKKNGEIFLITSDFLPNEDIKKLSEKYNYDFKIEKFSDNVDVVRGAKMVLDLYNITLTLR